VVSASLFSASTGDDRSPKYPAYVSAIASIGCVDRNHYIGSARNSLASYQPRNAELRASARRIGSMMVSTKQTPTGYAVGKLLRRSFQAGTSHGSWRESLHALFCRGGLDAEHPSENEGCVCSHHSLTHFFCTDLHGIFLCAQKAFLPGPAKVLLPPSSGDPKLY
jgi:hypothetical protein